MKNKTFETKEQYTNFKAQWKELFKDARKLDRNEFGNKIRKFTHLDFFFHAIICGKDPSKGYHNSDRYGEAFNDFLWFADRDINRYFGKYFTDDGLTAERAQAIIEDFRKSELAA